MPTEGAPAVFVLEKDDLSSSDAHAVLNGAVVTMADVDVIEVAGPGAVQCMQGLLTNDIEAPGAHAFVYGAVLTPKGMIICDLWIGREQANLAVVAPSHGVERLREVFTRSLPPRLAHTTARSDVIALRAAGPLALHAATAAGIEIPRPGTTVAGELGEVVYSAARPSQDMPFVLQITCTRGEHEVLLDAMITAGAVGAARSALEFARILSGWPRLDSEIDHKTLPQEVRYDAIDGVSYTKGCYTGQETVARLHFRGHTNRRLAGIRWDTKPSLDDATILSGDKPVGRVTSVTWVEASAAYVGLGVLRNQIANGEAVTAGGELGHIVELPLEI